MIVSRDAHGSAHVAANTRARRLGVQKLLHDVGRMADQPSAMLDECGRRPETTDSIRRRKQYLNPVP